MQGKFISIEGGEGAGKTTLVKSLVDALNLRGIKAIGTREPGGTPNAELIRHFIIDDKPEKLDPMTDFLLMSAARREHLTGFVWPALEQGIWVICDRFIDSSLAYQGFAAGLMIDDLLKIHNVISDSFMPDITFFIDVPPELGLDRVRARSLTQDEPLTRWDKMDLEFHMRIYHGFQKLSKKFSDRIATIKPGESIPETVQSLIHELQRRWPSLNGGDL